MNWIKIKDKLPPDDDDYLTYGDNIVQILSFTSDVDGIYWYNDNTNDEYNITHWMELPNSPAI